MKKVWTGLCAAIITIGNLSPVLTLPGAAALPALAAESTAEYTVRQTEDGLVLNCYADHAEAADYLGIYADVVIPETAFDLPVTALLKRLTDRVEELQSLTIPKTVSRIEFEDSYHSSWFMSFRVDPDNPCYESPDGVLIEKSTHTLLVYPRAKTDSIYTVPEGVRSIAPLAFYGTHHLQEVVLPEGVESIQQRAFDCSDVRRIVIPASVSQIEPSAVTNTYYLTEYSVAEDNPYYTTKDGVIFTKDMKTLVAYPSGSPDTSYTVPDSVLTIARSAFEVSPNLQTVSLGNVRSLESCAFWSCYALRSLTIPDSVTELGAYVAQGSHFTEVSFGRNLSAEQIADFINTSVSNSCTRITVSPDNLAASIHDGAVFSGDGQTLYCVLWSEETVDYTVPEGTTTIRKNAFAKAYPSTVIIPASVTDIQMPLYTVQNGVFAAENNPNYYSEDGFLFDKDQTVLYYAPHEYSLDRNPVYQMPETVKEIGIGAFSESNWLEEIRFGSSVQTLGDHAFSDCFSLNLADLPESVSRIGSGAMETCIQATVIIRNPECEIADNRYTLEVAEICGFSGSTAEQYAQKYQIPFRVLEDGDPIETATVTTVTDQTEYTGTYNYETTVTELATETETFTESEIETSPVVTHKITTASPQETTASETTDTTAAAEDTETVSVVETTETVTVSETTETTASETPSADEMTTEQLCFAEPQDAILYHFIPHGDSDYRKNSSVDADGHGLPNEWIAEPGATVTVDLIVERDPGTAGMQLYFDFAKKTAGAAGELKLVRNKQSSDAYMVSVTWNKQDLAYVWVTQNGRPIQAEDGAVMTQFIFELPQEPGSYTIDLNYHYEKENMVSAQGQPGDTAGSKFVFHGLTFVIPNPDAPDETQAEASASESNVQTTLTDTPETVFALDGIDCSDGMSAQINGCTAEFDADAAAIIQEQLAYSKAVLRMTQIDAADAAAFPQEQSNVLQSVFETGGVAYELTLQDSDGKSVTFSDGESGTVRITLPYVASDIAAEVKVYYISEDGTKTEMNAVYDPVQQTVSFVTTHFSIYVITEELPQTGNQDSTVLLMLLLGMLLTAGGALSFRAARNR